LAVVLLLIVAGVTMLSTNRSPSGGTLDIMAGQIQVGMTQEEAVRRILSVDPTNIDAVYVRGSKIDNGPFSGVGTRALEEFPPADQVRQVVIEVDDEKGCELVVTFLNGIVTGISMRKS
jgi:hypothetical protein